MTSISYPRAIASCLPMVGPFVAVYNVLKADREIPRGFAADMGFAPALRNLERLFQVFSGQGVSEQQAREVDTIRNRRISDVLLLLEEKRLYTICGLVGSVLSVACIVGLVALGILKTYLGFLGVGAYLIHVVAHARNWYLVNNEITELKRIAALRA